MLQNYSLLAESEVFSTFVDSIDDFVVDEMPWMTEQNSDEYLYQQLVYKVIVKPKVLISHIQRIYFTYSHRMTERLFAAVVDLLLVLEGNGHDLSHRMVASTHSLLTKQQFEELDNYLKHKNSSLLSGNKYSIFSKGLIGIKTLVEEQREDAIEHDALQIARDYIEYSQLDAAVETLENEVIRDLEREELQSELLNLYKVTKNISAFTVMHQKLMDNHSDLCDGWQELSDYFSGLNDEK